MNNLNVYNVPMPTTVATKALPHQKHILTQLQMRKLCDGDLLRWPQDRYQLRAEQVMAGPTQSDMLKHNTSLSYHVTPITAKGHYSTLLPTSQIRLQISFYLYVGSNTSSLTR